MAGDRRALRYVNTTQDGRVPTTASSGSMKSIVRVLGVTCTCRSTRVCLEREPLCVLGRFAGCLCVLWQFRLGGLLVQDRMHFLYFRLPLLCEPSIH